MRVHAALPELAPAPHHTADLGRRIRFVLYTAILVALICLAASFLSPASGGRRGRRARSSARAAPRASILEIGPMARTAARHENAE